MPKRSLRRLVVLASVLLAAGLVAPSRAQDSRARQKKPEAKKDPAELMQSLEQMVKEYQDENAALRSRVEALEAQVQKLKQSRVVNVLPQPGTPGQVPPTWQPFQFNGATYYVVPLAAGRAEARTQLLSQTAEQAGRTQGSARTIGVPAKQK